MNTTMRWLAGALVAPLLVAGTTVHGQVGDLDVTLRVLDEGEGEAEVMQDLRLPDAAAERGRVQSAPGLAIASAARVGRGGDDSEPVDADDPAPPAENPPPEITPLELPAEASDQARESAAYGLDTANEARERAREHGQARADEARQSALERRDDAQAAAQERAAVAREQGEAAREAAQSRAAEQREAGQARADEQREAGRARGEAQQEAGRDRGEEARDRGGPPAGVPGGPRN